MSGFRGGGRRMYQTSDDLWKDTNKPAKPETDTVTYLRQIEGLLDDFIRKEARDDSARVLFRAFGKV